MTTRATRKPFHDPFDYLSDEGFEREVLDSLDQATSKTSLGRTKRVAQRGGVPSKSRPHGLKD
jgi:hypothetical protein